MIFSKAIACFCTLALCSALVCNPARRQETSEAGTAGSAAFTSGRLTQRSQPPLTVTSSGNAGGIANSRSADLEASTYVAQSTALLAPSQSTGSSMTSPSMWCKSQRAPTPTNGTSSITSEVTAGSVTITSTTSTTLTSTVTLSLTSSLTLSSAHSSGSQSSSNSPLPSSMYSAPTSPIISDTTSSQIQTRSPSQSLLHATRPSSPQAQTSSPETYIIGVGSSATTTFGIVNKREEMKDKQIETSTLTTWTMVESPRESGSRSTSSSTSLPERAGESVPLAESGSQPRKNGARTLKIPRPTALLALLGLCLLFNMTSATSPPAPSPSSQMTTTAKVYPPFECTFSTQGYIMDDTVYTFSTIIPCPTDFVITDIANAPFEATSPPFPRSSVSAVTVSSSPSQTALLSPSHIVRAINPLEARKGGGGGHGGGDGGGDGGSGGRGGSDSAPKSGGHGGNGVGAGSKLRIPHVSKILTLSVAVCIFVFMPGVEAIQSLEAVAHINLKEEPIFARASEHHLMAGKGNCTPKGLLLALAIPFTMSWLQPTVSALDAASKDIIDPTDSFTTQDIYFNDTGMVYTRDCGTKRAGVPSASRAEAAFGFSRFIALGLLAICFGAASANQPASDGSRLLAPGVVTSTITGPFSPESSQLTYLASVGSNSTTSSTQAFLNWTEPVVFQSSMTPALTSPASHTNTNTSTSTSGPFIVQPVTITRSTTTQVCVYGSGWPDESAGATGNCSCVPLTESMTVNSAQPASTATDRRSSPSIKNCSNGPGQAYPCPSSAAKHSLHPSGRTILGFPFYLFTVISSCRRP